jgi:drug/metabolite transporter (DMT)-like permease
MGIMTSVLWALSMIIQKWAIKTYSIEALSLTFWRAILLGLVTWALWYFQKNNKERKHVFAVGYKKWLSPCLAGVFSLAIGGIALARAFAITPVSIATPITASNPVIAAVIARFVFNEKLSPVQWVGIFLVIIAGVEVSS